MVEVVERLVDVVERVALGVQLDPALGVERHQLRELGVVADQAPDHRDLREDHVDGRHLDGAAVANHDVGPALAQHLHRLLLHPALAHEVDDDLGASRGQLPDLLDRAVATHHPRGAQLAGELLRGR